MTQSIYDRCLLIFAFFIVILALLVGCTPPTIGDANPANEQTATTPTETPQSKEQFDEPLIGELSFEERPSPEDPNAQIIHLILINATLAADDEEVARDGRGLETPLRQLDHCSSIFFDGEQLTISDRPLSSRATYVMLMDYAGISLSTGGDNSRQKILTADDTEYQVPLALDTDFTFYTIDLGETYGLHLWQGEQNGNQVSTEYKRPLSGQFGRVTLSEAHTITILHNVPVTYRDPIECD